MDQVHSLRKTFLSQISKVINLQQIDSLNIEYLGRNGKINELLQEIKNLQTENKKSFGTLVNNLKQEINVSLESKKKEILKQDNQSDFFDPTLPGKLYPKGTIHPTTIAIEEISRIFEKIGFIRMSYPEVEWEYFSFEVLNMPAEHPARDDFETAFIDAPKHAKYGKVVLTPHTSSGQVREMKRLGKPPIRMINIAKTYRPNLDSTHTPMFHQFEGLCVDKGINITHLKGTISYFSEEFFGEKREIRLRPFHFRFTEPSFEVDVTCGICLGKGEIKGKKCSVCKSGWLELGGAGMVHPNVLKAGGINPRIYSGWAFGFGPERCFMMKDEVKATDLREFYNGDIRFLEQF
jgi:phenylalanyl-tRNA synthetase alpha chain